MRRNRDYDYFAAFCRLSGMACQAATMLAGILADYSPEKLPAQMTEMHELEHRADLTQHELRTQLAKEFITPIEREDILLMAQQLDEVVDQIEDVVQRLYMFNIQEIRPEAQEMGRVIGDCCSALQAAMVEFPQFKRSSKLKEYIIEVNRQEEVGDIIYQRAMRSLFTSCRDPLLVLTWSDTFDYLEKCCDACEHVANAMESIVMKNS